MDPGEAREVSRATRRIDGWFSATAAALFGLLDEAQRRASIEGPLFEIGVHHGKSAVLLGRMARPGETLGVCDTFGGEGMNASFSGSGDRALFERNMQRHAPRTNYLVFHRLSSELTPKELGAGYRFFHVDGGHLHEEALSDLRLAASVLGPQGVIALDDPFRAEWPGVTEALVDFCRETEFTPLTIGFNKALLTAPEARPIYTTALDELQWRYIDRLVYRRKELPVCGTPTPIFFTPSTWQLPDRAARPVALIRRASRLLRRVARADKRARRRG